MKQRLDQKLAELKLVRSRSQAESNIKLGKIKVNGKIVSRPGILVDDTDKIELVTREVYVSRAALKLASVAQAVNLDFKDAIVLDVGSSTGGFTDYVLQNGAKKVIAVDVGSNQLHASLQGDPRIDLHEKTDIRDFKTKQPVDLVLIDVSFISLRLILPAVSKLIAAPTPVVAMVKPQFEAGQANLKHKGVIKNDRVRREILKDFEAWVSQSWKVLAKADSAVPGAKGNRERFYLLRKA